MSKQCLKCLEVKPLNGFNKKARAKDGYDSTCRSCRNDYEAQRRKTPNRQAKQAIYFARYKRRKAEKKLGIEIPDTLKPYDTAIIQGADECIYCGKDLEPGEVTIDHAKAFAVGGANEYTNLLPACSSCNTSKGTKHIYEFLVEKCEERHRKNVIFTLAQRNLTSYDDMERQLIEEAAERIRDDGKSAMED